MLENHLRTHDEFARRHIGPNDVEVEEMLGTLGFENLDEMANQVIPQQIRTRSTFEMGDGVSEFELLRRLKKTMTSNKIFRSYLGLGYHDTITPTVIQRNIFENPVWYTAYTPYQAEIAQGRLEALLNFQTMVMDLTGMEIANASLLDEGTAAAEAMAMAHAICKKSGTKHFLVSPSLHPHVIEVLKTRSEPLGLEMILEEPEDHDFSQDLFAIFVGYPDTHGIIKNYPGSGLAKVAHDKGALLVVGADLLSLTLLTPPGEWGADIVYGNSQRFGVPLGFGGPHAAFIAAKDTHKRLLPGRIVGVSVDAQGQPALRLALQTREQHIRREKATSNICTAQVLLANMASMYAVYHGPHGLKKIAQRVHLLANLLAQGLGQVGWTVTKAPFFDTVLASLPDGQPMDQVRRRALEQGVNFRYLGKNALTIALDETTTLSDVHDIINICGGGQDVRLSPEQAAIQHQWPAHFVRSSKYLTHPVFNSHHSETELLRYIHSLQNKDVTLTHSMIPLGSCTMKLNATTELAPVSWPEINKLHPFAPVDQAVGMIEMIKDLEQKLADLTGFSAVSLQPNAGSQGEYAGLLVIRKYHASRGEAHRDICLIPSSAHGTNPASAVMAGMKVVVVECDDQGNVNINDLKAKAKQYAANLAALMVTYPSTHGVFEEGIVEICDVVHQNGGQVYMDGANMNALVGLCRPAEFGADVSHMNLHKTFAIPHGGGGPGVGPIGVREHLAPFLPTHSLVPEAGPASGVSSTTSAPWGSASILPISWAYITMMGLDGLRRATLVSILSANYIAKKLEPHYPVVYRGKEGLVAHECIIDLRAIKRDSGIDVTDVAKRLIDYGFHAPTMSWPVVGTLMIEPTESEPKAELDRFIEAMISIREEIREVEAGRADAERNVLRNAPHTARVLMTDSWSHPYSREKAGFPLPWVRGNKIFPAVGRVDNAYGDRNLVCACPAVDSYR